MSGSQKIRPRMQIPWTVNVTIKSPTWNHIQANVIAQDADGDEVCRVLNEDNGLWWEHERGNEEQPGCRPWRHKQLLARNRKAATWVSSTSRTILCAWPTQTGDSDNVYRIVVHYATVQPCTCIQYTITYTRHTHAHSYIHVVRYARTHAHTRRSRACTHTHARTHTHAHTHIRTCTRTCTHLHIGQELVSPR